MHYVTDTKEVRAAHEAVTEAKENIQTANLQKEISSLNDIMDDLDKKIEESNKYYDELIKQAEKYWDSLIKNLEDYRSRWKELSEIEEQAKMEAALKNLGIATDDALNMSESAFQSFKGTYLGVLQEMYSGNDEMINMLQKFGGISAEALSPLSDTAGSAAESIDRFADSMGNANANASESSESVRNLSASTAELNGNLSGVSGTLGDIIGEGKLAAITGQVDDVAEAIREISDALSGMPGSIDMGGSIEQFEALGKSVNKATASISGGVVSKADTSDGTSGKNATNTKGSSENGSGSLASAIKEVKHEADKSIGTGGDSGATGKFNQLGRSAADVADTIGGGSKNRSGSGNGGNDGSGSLTSSIENLGETATETLGEPGGDGVIGKFGGLSDTIAEAESHVEGIIDGLNTLDGMEAECTITVNIVTSGGVPGYASGTAIDGTINSMDLNRTGCKPKYGGNAHMEGTAKVTGDWGVRDAGKALVGELGQEIVVSSNGKWRTVGDNGAEFAELQKGDIVFNHLQTRELLSRGNLVGRGRALAGGTAHTNGTVNDEPPHYPSQETLDFMKKSKQWEMQMKLIADNTFGVLSPLHEIQRNVGNMVSNTSSISNVNNIANNKNIQPVVNNEFNITMPNVTNSTSAESLMKDLQSLATKKFQVNW